MVKSRFFEGTLQQCTNLRSKRSEETLGKAARGRAPCRHWNGYATAGRATTAPQQAQEWALPQGGNSSNLRPTAPKIHL